MCTSPKECLRTPHYLVLHRYRAAHTHLYLYQKESKHSEVRGSQWYQMGVILQVLYICGVFMICFKVGTRLNNDVEGYHNPNGLK